ncbi:MAG: hypothetical protein WCC37_22755 [Candidatus Sulfotelmatobacter sp.]|jgi:hypothetical protein
MGKRFERALTRFQKQKAEALARDDARKNALALKQARVLCRVGEIARKAAKREQAAAKAKMLAEQPARLEAYVNAVVAWVRMSPRKRKQTPSPSAADFGILNETKAIDYLFSRISFE